MPKVVISNLHIFAYSYPIIVVHIEDKADRKLIYICAFLLMSQR